MRSSELFPAVCSVSGPQDQLLEQVQLQMSTPLMSVRERAKGILYKDRSSHERPRGSKLCEDAGDRGLAADPEVPRNAGGGARGHPGEVLHRGHGHVSCLRDVFLTPPRSIQSSIL